MYLALGLNHNLKPMIKGIASYLTFAALFKIPVFKGQIIVKGVGHS